MRLAPLLLGLVLVAPLAAAAFPASAPAPASLAVARATSLLNTGSWLGKSPQGWLDWSEAQAIRPLAARGPSGDLVGGVLALYAAAGVQASDAQVAELRADAAKLGPAQAAYAPLVRAVAQGYAAQAALAQQLDVAAIQPGGSGVLLPAPTAQATMRNAEAVLAAVHAFVQDARALPDAQAVPNFEDPLGLVVLDGTGDDVVTPGGVLGQPVLVADLGGNDLYTNSAGGACAAKGVDTFSDCNGLALAVSVDVAGDDTYHTGGPLLNAQGAGAFGGLGILVDAQGNDTYIVDETADHEPNFPLLGFYVTGVSQGAGEAGVGLLLDAAGNDHYAFNLVSDAFSVMGAQGQGFGGLGGSGFLLDAAGNDVYTTRVSCHGAPGQFCGLYTDAVALYPGVAVLLDVAGDDTYDASVVAPYEDYYAQSFAGFGGLSIMVDLTGNDVYRASATSTSGGPDLNCAYGTAEYAGALGIFIDAAGDDSYYDETIAPPGAAGPYTMAEGFSLASGSLFWDVSGNDVHSMFAKGSHPALAGRGLAGSLLDTAALYLDTGGVDTYADYTQVWGKAPVKQNFGSDAHMWGVGGTHGAGADVNLVPALPPV